jgi:hypothetical protein
MCRASLARFFPAREPLLDVLRYCAAGYLGRHSGTRANLLVERKLLTQALIGNAAMIKLCQHHLITSGGLATP